MVPEWAELGNEPLEQGIGSEGASAEKFEWNQFHLRLEQIYGQSVNAKINKKLAEVKDRENFVSSRDGRCFTIIAIWIRLLQKEERIKTSAAMLQIPGFCAIVKAIL